jgi:ABC-type uncharacterized transport system substrate-binding protein
VEGKNLVVLRFTSGGQSERIPDTAREVVAATPDVIFAFTSRMVQQLKKTTTSIPIVGYTSDSISFGIAEDLLHSGKNITGVATEASVHAAGAFVGNPVDDDP